MNKTYFITSDVHSFYKPFKTALDKAGFDEKNKDHILVINGDIFDRGPDSILIYDYLKSLPKDRRILIRGNHEDMIGDIVKRGYFQSHDYHNCSDKTILQFYKRGYDEKETDTHTIIQYFKSLKITDWFQSDEWVNYLEIGNYIITHAFLPLEDKKEGSVYYNDLDSLSYIPDWRELPVDSPLWENARWGCPFTLFYSFFKEEKEKNKILVCGHWHVSDFHASLEHKYNDYSIYCRDQLIGLDACTALSNRCNILIINSDNGKCYDGESKKEFDFKKNSTSEKPCFGLESRAA